MVKWIGKCTLLLKRLGDAWMDMLPLPTMSAEARRNQHLADVVQRNEDRRSRNADVLSPDAQETQDSW